MNAVNGEEDLLIVTKAGIVIRINLARVSEQSRQTMGVRLIRLDDKDIVSSIAVVEASSELEVEVTEVPAQEE
jgi:DNA gyrase subunit A